MLQNLLYKKTHSHILDNSIFPPPDYTMNNLKYHKYICQIMNSRKEQSPLLLIKVFYIYICKDNYFSLKFNYISLG